MRKLKFADATFLYAETNHAPMNIASVQLLDIPESLRDNYFPSLLEYLRDNIYKIGFMTRKLIDTPFAMDQPIWVTDSNFDIERHVHRITLPAPGTFRQLEQLVGKLHERPLDRRFPLWQFYLIEGLKGGRCAWYTKYHHACIDGMAGQQIIDVLFSDDPLGKPDFERPVASPETVPPLASQWFDAIVNATFEPFLNMLSLPATMRVSQSIGESLSDPASAGIYGQPAPKTPFNVTVSQYRNVAFGTIPLSRVRLLGKQCSASINDIFLAVCSGGLRRYLLRKGLLPEQTLIASVPVSLRKPGDVGMDNRVSMLLASLASDIEDPLQRLNAIRESTAISKRMVVKMSEMPASDPHIPGMPMIAATLAQFAENMRLADTVAPIANVVISNVPGPRTEKYLCGAKMLTHYPVSIAANGSALNITVQSYLDRMDFSITACLEAVPDADDLCMDMLASWRELEKLVVAGRGERVAA